MAEISAVHTPDLSDNQFRFPVVVTSAQHPAPGEPHTMMTLEIITEDPLTVRIAGEVHVGSGERAEQHGGDVHLGQ